MLWETGTNRNEWGSRGLGGRGVGSGRVEKAIQGSQIFHRKLRWWMCVSVHLPQLPKCSPPRPRPDLSVALSSATAYVHRLRQRLSCQWDGGDGGRCIGSAWPAQGTLCALCCTLLGTESCSGNVNEKRKRKMMHLWEGEGKYLGQGSQEGPVCRRCELNVVSKVNVLRKWDEIYMRSCP